MAPVVRSICLKDHVHDGVNSAKTHEGSAEVVCIAQADARVRLPRGDSNQGPAGTAACFLRVPEHVREPRLG